MGLVFPVLEQDFQSYVRASGHIKITLKTNVINDKEIFAFTLSTEKIGHDGSEHDVMLYARTRPMPKSFSSLKALYGVLGKCGYTEAMIPLCDGSAISYLHKESRGGACPPIVVNGV